MNSAGLFMFQSSLWRRLVFCDEWQQSDEASTHNGCPHGSLIDGRCAGATARQNAAFSVDQCAQHLQVLVVHIDWSRDHAVRAKRALHLLLFETGATLTELLQICF